MAFKICISVKSTVQSFALSNISLSAVGQRGLLSSREEL